MSETRKLAAILVADVVGYSRLAGAQSDNPVFLRQRERVIDALRAAGSSRGMSHLPDDLALNTFASVDRPTSGNFRYRQ
jgi:class 3 adenylate cyclase